MPTTAPTTPAPLKYDVIDGGFPVPNVPSCDPTEIALGLFLSSIRNGPSTGDYNTYSRRLVKRFRGVGLTANAEGWIDGCVVAGCWIGARMATSDSAIRGCMVKAARDINLHVAKDAGNVQSVNNHYYGGRLILWNQGGWQFRSTLDTIADGFVGAILDAESTFTNCMWQHNSIRDVVVRGGDNLFSACTFNGQLEIKEQPEFNVAGFDRMAGKMIAEVNGGGCEFNGCKFILTDWINRTDKGEPLQTPTGRAAKAIQVNANTCTITGRIIDADKLDGTTGIEVNNSIHGLFIDSTFVGFGDQAAKALTFSANGSCGGLDATIRIEAATKPLVDYVNLARWSGRVRIIDRATGEWVEVKK